MSGQVYRQEHSGDSEEEKPRRGVISDGSAPLRVTDRLDPDCHSFPHSEVYPRAWVTRGTTGSLPSTCSQSKGDTDKSSGHDHSKERARMWFGVPGREGEACTMPHLERFHRSQATSRGARIRQVAALPGDRGASSSCVQSSAAQRG